MENLSSIKSRNLKQIQVIIENNKYYDINCIKTLKTLVSLNEQINKELSKPPVIVSKCDYKMKIGKKYTEKILTPVDISKNETEYDYYTMTPPIHQDINEEDSVDTQSSLEYYPEEEYTEYFY